MNNKGFVSLSTIVTIIIGICGILIANLAIITSRIYLLNYIKTDVRTNIKNLDYPICKWSSASTMVIPKAGGSASNTLYVTCSSLNGVELNNYTYENLTDKTYLNNNFDTIINSLIEKDSKIEISYLTVYKESFSYKFVFGIKSTTVGEYTINFKADVLKSNGYNNKKITSNKISVVNET